MSVSKIKNSPEIMIKSLNITSQCLPLDFCSIDLLSLIKNLTKLFVILGILFLIFYIFQVSQNTKFSYQLAQYEKKVKSLSFDIENLQSMLASRDISKEMESLAKNLNFEKIGSIDYIAISESKMAERNNILPKSAQ